MICQNVNEASIRTLLSLFVAPGTVFLVGAGASSRLFPDSSKSLRCELLASRSFGYSADGVSDLVKDKLVLKPAQKAPDLVWEMIGVPETALCVTPCLAAQKASERISVTGVKAMHLACATLSYSRADIPEYSVFRLCRPTAIATTNYDGLAASCLRGSFHSIMQLHGVVPFRLVKDEGYVRLTRNCFSFAQGMRPVMDNILRHQDLWLPQPEEERILQTPNYEDFDRSLETCKALVVIGYSFSEMQDIYTFNTVAAKLKDRPCSLLFVSYPTPDSSCAESAALLSQAARCRNTLVIKADWAALACSIVETYRTHPVSLPSLSALVAENYSRTRDRLVSVLNSERERQCRNCVLHKELA